MRVVLYYIVVRASRRVAEMRTNATWSLFRANNNLKNQFLSYKMLYRHTPCSSVTIALAARIGHLLLDRSTKLCKGQDHMHLEPVDVVKHHLEPQGKLTVGNFGSRDV